MKKRVVRLLVQIVVELIGFDTLAREQMLHGPDPECTRPKVVISDAGLWDEFLTTVVAGAYANMRYE